MKNLKVAVAQIPSVKGDVDENVKMHLLAIKKASKEKVDYLVFPELSLTGYEPELAKKLAFSKLDIRLEPLIEAAIKNDITLAIGAPIESSDLPKIGLIIIANTGKVEVYEKMFLHQGEELFFSKGNKPCMLSIADSQIANAICADTNNPKHVQAYAQFGADVYIAGVLISEGGYDADTAVLAGYAKQFNMLVAMANHNKPSGNWKPIGRSAIWSNKGLLACANETENALIIAEKLGENWVAEVVVL